MNRKQKLEVIKRLASGKLSANEIRLLGFTQLPTWVFDGYSREEIIEQYGEIKEVNGKVYARIEAGEVPRWFDYKI